MSNCYTEFYEEVYDIGPIEQQWLSTILGYVGETGVTLKDLKADCPHCTRADLDLLALLCQDNDCCGFEYHFLNCIGTDGVIFTIQGVGCGDVEQVAVLMAAFLKKFRPRKHFSMTYAVHGDGESTGGGILVTAPKTYCYNPNYLIDQQIQKLAAAAKKERAAKRSTKRSKKG